MRSPHAPADPTLLGLSRSPQLDNPRRHLFDRKHLERSTIHPGCRQEGVSLHRRAYVRPREDSQRRTHRKCQCHRNIPHESTLGRPLSRQPWNTLIQPERPHGALFPRHGTYHRGEMATRRRHQETVDRFKMLPRIQLRGATLGGACHSSSATRCTRFLPISYIIPYVADLDAHRLSTLSYLLTSSFMANVGIRRLLPVSRFQHPC